MNLVNRKRAIGLLCKKQHSKVLLYYDSQERSKVVKKIIHSEESDQLLYYQKIIRGQLFFSVLMEIQLSIEHHDKYLQFKAKYYACKSLKAAIIDLNNKNKYFQAFQFIPIFSNLIRIFIQDGNRQFIPTSSNIFIEQTEAYANLYSIVGIQLFKSTQPFISKQDFIEIAPLLTTSLLQGLQAGKKADYVKIKQRALLLVVVTMVENKQFGVQNRDEIPQKLTLKEAAKYILKFNNFLAKYLTTSIFQKKLSQRKIPLNIYEAIKSVIVNDASLSWPELIDVLVATKPKSKTHDFDLPLYQTALGHWRQLPKEQKNFLQEAKIVNVKGNDIPFDMKHISLYLTLYTNAPFSSLLSEGSFTAILDKQTDFDKEGCTTIKGLMKITNQFEKEKRKESDSLSNYSRQQSKETCLYGRQLRNGLNLVDLIGIAQRKMIKKIPKSKGRPICVQHPMLQSLRLYKLALR